MWYKCKDSKIDQQNINKVTCKWTTDFPKSTKIIQWRKDSLFNKGAESTEYTHTKKKKKQNSFIPHPKYKNYIKINWQ